jgi:hypothetical protein
VEERRRPAVAARGVLLPTVPARFAVGIDFYTPAARNAYEVWDLDNLVMLTLDALEGQRGPRAAVLPVDWTRPSTTGAISASLPPKIAAAYRSSRSKASLGRRVGDHSTLAC